MTVSWNVLMNHIIQMNNNFTACVQSVRHMQRAHMISDGRATGQSQLWQRSVQGQTKFVSSIVAGHRCHKPCFVHVLLHNTANFIVYRSNSMKLYDTFNAILVNIPLQYYIFHSQGSVATLIRWGGWSSYIHLMRHSWWNLTVKTALKSVDFWRSYRQK